MHPVRTGGHLLSGDLAKTPDRSAASHWLLLAAGRIVMVVMPLMVGAATPGPDPAVLGELKQGFQRGRAVRSHIAVPRAALHLSHVAH
eukprot:1150961-Pelagomonas_calceolata.AAC.10